MPGHSSNHHLSFIFVNRNLWMKLNYWLPDECFMFSVFFVGFIEFGSDVTGKDQSAKLLLTSHDMVGQVWLLSLHIILLVSLLEWLKMVLCSSFYLLVFQIYMTDIFSFLEIFKGMCNQHFSCVLQIFEDIRDRHFSNVSCYLSSKAKELQTGYDVSCMLNHFYQ